MTFFFGVDRLFHNHSIRMVGHIWIQLIFVSSINIFIVHLISHEHHCFDYRVQPKIGFVAVNATTRYDFR